MNKKERQQLVSLHIEAARTGKWGEFREVAENAIPLLLRAGVTYKPIFYAALARCSPTAQITFLTFSILSNQGERDIRKTLNKWFLAV